MQEKNFISCVIYMHNEGARIRFFLEQLSRTLEEHFEKYELICVNDCCTDDTIGQIHNFLEQCPQTKAISLINLSYYQGMEAAMNAGRDLAVGDFLFEFDSCSVDYEPTLIMELYDRALEGYDVVAAAPKKDVSLTSKLFYQIYNWGSKHPYKLRQERFRIISRRAINRVNQMNVYIPYRKAMYMNCGLKADTISYENKRQAHREWGREERGTRSNLAIDTIIIFTDVLEKLSLLTCIILFGALMIMFGYLIYSIFSAERPVEGWLSIMSLMSFGFFMLSVMLTLIFKYLSVILNMSFKRQRYVIEGVEKLTK